jgi:RNA polymerase sigma-54 factor
MAVSIKLGLKQSQRLVLTQSLRQSIELLQLSTIELAEKISEELVENPILEEEGASMTPSADNEDGEALLKLNRKLSGDDVSPAPERESDYNDETGESVHFSEPDDGKKQFIENAVIQEETLKDHLLWQARLSAGNDREQAVLESLITSIDDSGFLTDDPENIASENGFDFEEVKKAVRVINGFDPVGCGVRSVQDTLLVQAEYFYPLDSLLRVILKDYFSDLEKLNHEKIGRSLGVPIREVGLKSKLIQSLDPYPGSQYSPKKTKYIIPDIEVKFIDNNLIISMNDDWVPKIGINSYYINMIRKKNIEKKLREYIQDKMQSAKYLIRNISTRRDTILKVVKSIMEHQTEFLIKGPGHLRPLIHTDISGEVGLHESTVSRVTSNKFVQTPWGVFELKYFFVSRIKSGETGEVSSDEVMNLIKDIISQENPLMPYSDEMVLARLKTSGIEVARRTVSKYRGILNIPSSGKRKKMNMIKIQEGA